MDSAVFKYVLSVLFLKERDLVSYPWKQLAKGLFGHAIAQAVSR
jgi:hypothetical protein